MATQIVAAAQGWRALVLMLEVVGGSDAPATGYDPNDNDPEPLVVTAVEYAVAAFSVDDVAGEATPLLAVAGITPDALVDPYGGVVKYTVAGDPTAGTGYRNVDELCAAAFATAHTAWAAAQTP